MNFHTLSCCGAVGLLCAGWSFHCAAEDPFPAFGALAPETVLPKNARLTVAPEGHFLLNGAPRYLPGTIFYEGCAAAVERPTPGYSPDLKWFYENLHNYEEHQRIGFDATGAAVGNGWIEKYRPGMRRAFRDNGEKQLARVFTSGLPLYVDFTCSPWHHGQLRYQPGQKPSADAFSTPGVDIHHWLPYNLNSPEGRQLYIDMWTYGVDFLTKRGARGAIFELFNEPDYNDIGEYNRKLFSERLAKRYGKIDRLNAEWHTGYSDFAAVGRFKRVSEVPALAVEWGKFMEESFTEMCRIGAETIRKHVPNRDAIICFQPLNSKTTNVNLFAANQFTDAVCGCTGGGSAVNVREYLAIADGKPIFDGETYPGTSEQEIRDRLWVQYARGYNASFLFKWDRRPWDKLWLRPDGGKRLAQSLPFLLQNPAYIAARELRGIRRAKEEILRVNHLFTPRDRGVKSEVALLFSRATRRLARATGNNSYQLYYDFAVALDDTPLAYDVMFCEQLRERGDRYALLLAPGIACALPDELAALEQYVRQGGTLVLVNEAMQNNEYGFPRTGNTFPAIDPGEGIRSEIAPLRFDGVEFAATRVRNGSPGAGYRAVGTINGIAAAWEKKIGRGRVLYFAVRLPASSRAILLRHLAERLKIKRLGDFKELERQIDAIGLEVHPARRDGENALALWSTGRTVRGVAFRPAERGLQWLDLYRGRLLAPGEDGTYPLLLRPNSPIVLIGGSPETLARYGKTRPFSASEARREIADAIAAEARARQAVVKAFAPDPACLRLVDLRDKANSGYLDRIAGDGKGGWTDQGENCLRNVPWEVTDCNGVPIDFIRPDMNGGRSCIVLGSRKLPDGASAVNGIRIGSKAVHLYFLHAAAWTSGHQTVMTYRVHYSDGSVVEIPIRNGIEVADWYRMSAKHPDRVAAAGWANSENRGMWLYCWKNPMPEKTIESLDIVSAWNDAIGMVGGITLELPSDAVVRLPMLGQLPQKAFHAACWRGAKLAYAAAKDEIEIRLNEKSQDWCGANFRLKTPLDIPPGGRAGSLVYEVNGTADSWGIHRGGLDIQLKLPQTDADGKALKAPYLSLSANGVPRIDDRPETWQTVRIPLERLLLPRATHIEGLLVQFKRLAVERSGIAIRHVRIEFPQKQK